jgi:hypothetical protein
LVHADTGTAAGLVTVPSVGAVPSQLAAWLLPAVIAGAVAQVMGAVQFSASPLPVCVPTRSRISLGTVTLRLRCAWAVTAGVPVP